jgi:hypothetical protein|nr:MAG: helix-turn-helix domain protein [Bacteriophage sp.]
MDIVLERILSLIPKGKNGKYAHGAKVKFAKSIGYNDGSIVSMWENGASVSYTKKLHQIADIYNVSVEWLKGETDDPGIKKAPTDKIDERILDAGLIKRLVLLTPDELRRVDDFVQGILASRKA